MAVDLNRLDKLYAAAHLDAYEWAQESYGDYPALARELRAARMLRAELDWLHTDMADRLPPNHPFTKRLGLIIAAYDDIAAYDAATREPGGGS